MVLYIYYMGVKLGFPT